MSMPKVTVIIVSWNALPIVQRCLPSVVKTDWANLEVVLADNASTDGTADWVATHWPSVRVMRHAENWRFCRGNNEVIRTCASDYVVLLNNDVEVEPDWLEHLVSMAEQDSSIAAVQPKILQFDHRERFEYAGAAGGYLDRVGYPFARGRIFDHLECDMGQYDHSPDLDWASGAALMLRRSALGDVGLLDESFEMHMEEIDLCWRLRSAGYRITLAPLSRVYHMGGATLPTGHLDKLYFNVRNSLLMMRKNLGPADWRRVATRRWCMDHAIAALWLLTGRARRTRALLKAYADARRMRARIPRPVRTRARPSYHGTILWDYLVRRRRTVQELPGHRFRASGP